MSSAALSPKSHNTLWWCCLVRIRTSRWEALSDVVRMDDTGTCAFSNVCGFSTCLSWENRRHCMCRFLSMSVDTGTQNVSTWKEFCCEFSYTTDSAGTSRWSWLDPISTASRPAWIWHLVLWFSRRCITDRSVSMVLRVCDCMAFHLMHGCGKCFQFQKNMLIKL